MLSMEKVPPEGIQYLTVRQGDKVCYAAQQGKGRGLEEYDGDPLGTLLASLSASHPMPAHTGGSQVGIVVLNTY